MATSLDVLVSTTLAHIACAKSDRGDRAISGQSFERKVFRVLEGIAAWEHCVGPDHFDMALDLVGKTGTHYEFDGAFLAQNTLYVVEAKKVKVLTRQHIGIFVHKLLDILLASHDHFDGIAIMPILVSAGPQISPAAWLHAISWGVLLVSPQRATPQEYLAHFERLPESVAAADLRAECEQLARWLWRPIDHLVYPSQPTSLLYTIATDQILDGDTCRRLLEEWEQCSTRMPTRVPAVS